MFNKRQSENESSIRSSLGVAALALASFGAGWGLRSFSETSEPKEAHVPATVAKSDTPEINALLDYSALKTKFEGAQFQTLLRPLIEEAKNERRILLVKDPIALDRKDSEIANHIAVVRELRGKESLSDQAWFIAKGIIDEEK
jgi:hypothetical protein